MTITVAAFDLSQPSIYKHLADYSPVNGIDMNILNNLRLILILCLTLGLAPYFPEPHIWGKIKWLWGGGVGMKPMDYFDFLFHGAPFILLIRYLVVHIVQKKSND